MASCTSLFLTNQSLHQETHNSSKSEGRKAVWHSNTRSKKLRQFLHCRLESSGKASHTGFTREQPHKACTVISGADLQCT
ncbi:hypothetical protein ACOSQ4_013562 [Xanthoceras sorbifolium]